MPAGCERRKPSAVDHRDRSTINNVTRRRSHSDALTHAASSARSSSFNGGFQSALRGESIPVRCATPEATEAGFESPAAANSTDRL